MWNKFLLPPLPPLSKLTSFTKTTHSYFDPDLIDEDNKRTHWAHTASVWETLFKGVFEFANSKKTFSISPKF